MPAPMFGTNVHGGRMRENAVVHAPRRGHAMTNETQSLWHPSVGAKSSRRKRVVFAPSSHPVYTVITMQKGRKRKAFTAFLLQVHGVAMACQRYVGISYCI